MKRAAESAGLSRISIMDDYYEKRQFFLVDLNKNGD